MNPSGKFEFNGDVASYFGVAVLTFILILFTLGIGTPWALVMKQKWIASHTKIEGRRLKFVGDGAELFGRFIIWLILTWITLGIYSLWVGPKLQKWITEHTDFE